MLIEKTSIDDNVLRKLQMTQIEILDEIVRICNKFNLKYYLIGGTLLGAVRHKGFIPWDDDLDIAMPRDDFNRFIEICKKNLNDNYFVHWITTDDKFWLSFAKVRKKGTVLAESILNGINVSKEIYVDIFPLDNAICVDNKSQKLTNKLILILKTALVRKLGRRDKKSFKLSILDFLVKFISFKTIHRLFLSLATKYNDNETEYYINYGSNYSTEKQTMPKSVYEPENKLRFEEKEYSVPNDYDYVLSRIYGDYMRLPPEEDRVFRHKPEYIDFGD